MTDSNAAIRTVGYIGLGTMGKPIAHNLIAADYEVVLWNRSPAAAIALARQGAVVMGNASDLAARVDAVGLNLTDAAAVDEVLFADNGILAGAPRGLIVFDNSTISPTETRRIAAKLADRGVTFVDAPVSGGESGAREGSLSIMVGGPESAVARLMPLLRTLGGRVTHMGEVGSGQVCKACNQIAVTLALLGVCESLSLAKKSGLDLQKTIDVLGAGAGGSWQMNNLGPRIARGELEPGFMIDLLVKDLRIVREEAAGLGLTLEGATLAERLFRELQAEGLGAQGTQALSRALENSGGFRFAGSAADATDNDP